MWMFNLDANRDRYQEMRRQAEHRRLVREALKAHRGTHRSIRVIAGQMLIAAGRFVVGNVRYTAPPTHLQAEAPQT